MRAVRTPGPADLAAAREVVQRELAVTPVVPVRGLDDVVVKLETFQPTGSFKVRGALAAVAAVVRSEPGRPVVAASAGNHALGIAFAAGRLGVDATVVVPATASPAKLAALERVAVRLVRHGASYEDAERHALELAADGAHFISPYNDPDVIAGQATVGVELLEQVPGLSTIVAPVGGGGLVAGLAWATAHESAVRVLGVEAERSRALSAAVRAGEVVAVDVGSTLADGLAGNLEPGTVTLALVRRFGAHLLAVSEPEIAHAIRFLAKEQGLVVEGSAAVALAPLLGGRIGPGSGTTAVVLTGRNIAPAVLAGVLAG